MYGLSAFFWDVTSSFAYWAPRGHYAFHINNLAVFNSNSHFKPIGHIMQFITRVSATALSLLIQKYIRLSPISYFRQVYQSNFHWVTGNILCNLRAIFYYQFNLAFGACHTINKRTCSPALGKLRHWGKHVRTPFSAVTVTNLVIICPCLCVQQTSGNFRFFRNKVNKVMHMHNVACCIKTGQAGLTVLVNNRAVGKRVHF